MNGPSTLPLLSVLSLMGQDDLHMTPARSLLCTVWLDDCKFREFQHPMKRVVIVIVGILECFRLYGYDATL